MKKDNNQHKTIGLRIDVDTYRGTKYGVPALLEILNKYQIKATFYFSVGPDNMGRHLWRLFKPAFLIKMLKSNAAGLYGPEIIFMGTLFPGPLIGKRLARQIKAVYDAGHEIGLHAWDHHKIQSKIDRLTVSELINLLKKGSRELEKITGKFPVSSAAPGWRCNDNMLKAKATLPFKYNSDCRGDFIFKPDIEKAQIQIPVTLPTYDELIGNNGVSDKNYNSVLIKKLKSDELNILTIHAEVEGGKCSEMFDEFLEKTIKEGWIYNTLGSFIPDDLNLIPYGQIEPKNFEGREGWLAVQSEK